MCIDMKKCNRIEKWRPRRPFTIPCITFFEAISTM
jgi:hypothetical protein